MAATTFDALDYFEKLKKAGVPEEQAKIQANAFRDFSIIQDEKAKQKLATRGDIQDVRIEMKGMEMRLTEKLESGKHEMLKWMIGLIITQSAMLIAIFAFLR